MKHNLLVVDDDEEICVLLDMAFTNLGYSVCSASSAEEALVISKIENIQIMFLDLKLPNMNGIDLCREIRKDKPIALIYAITGYGSPSEFAKCREVGFDDYFTKPFEMKLLLKAAEDAFEKIDGWTRQQV